MNKHELHDLIVKFKTDPKARPWVLQRLRSLGQSIIANRLAVEGPDARNLVAIKKKKRVPLVNSLFGLLGIGASDELSRNKKNIDKIAAVMLQSIRDMLNSNMSGGARILALKNYEESRSTLEDTAKNYPASSVRDYAMSKAREVLNSVEAKKLKPSGLGYVSASPYLLGIGNAGLPYKQSMLGSAFPDFMK